MSITILTLNLNRLTSAQKFCALREYIAYCNPNICFLQEVVTPHVATVPRYERIVNIDPESHTGTAILYKEEYQASNPQLLVNGRGIACMILGIHFINVYAPSGAAQKLYRAEFFNAQVPVLLKDPSNIIVLAGILIALTQMTTRYQ